MSTIRERTRAAKGQAPEVGYKPFRVNVDGQDVIVDQNTFTGKEQQLIKRELSLIGYPPDGEDRVYAAIWITQRRSDVSLTFDAFLDSITALDYLTTELVDPSEDDSPEV